MWTSMETNLRIFLSLPRQSRWYICFCWNTLHYITRFYKWVPFPAFARFRSVLSTAFYDNWLFSSMRDYTIVFLFSVFPSNLSRDILEFSPFPSISIIRFRNSQSFDVFRVISNIWNFPLISIAIMDFYAKSSPCDLHSSCAFSTLWFPFDLKLLIALLIQKSCHRFKQNRCDPLFINIPSRSFPTLLITTLLLSVIRNFHLTINDDADSLPIFATVKNKQKGWSTYFLLSISTSPPLLLKSRTRQL